VDTPREKQSPDTAGTSSDALNPSNALAEWLKPGLGLLRAVNSEPLTGDGESDRRKLLTTADAARRASLALRQTDPPSEYQVDAQALVLAVDEVETRAREASSCVVCGEPYSRHASALISFGSALKQVTADISSGGSK
jgi:hypothetical protein